MISNTTKIVPARLASDQLYGLIMSGFSPIVVSAEDHPQTYQKIARVLDKLLTVSPVPYKTINIVVLDDTQVNAASQITDGAPWIVVNYGTTMGSEGMLANTLGHELGHVIAHSKGENTGNDAHHQIDADKFGSELAYKAGFSKDEIMEDFRNNLDIPDRKNRAQTMINFVRNLK